MLMTAAASPLLGAVMLTILGLLAVVAITSTIVTIARDGYRRTPCQRLVRWCQRDDALRSPPTGSR
jgi:hypothetical protein